MIRDCERQLPERNLVVTGNVTVEGVSRTEVVTTRPAVVAIAMIAGPVPILLAVVIIALAVSVTVTAVASLVPIPVVASVGRVMMARG